MYGVNKKIIGTLGLLILAAAIIWVLSGDFNFTGFAVYNDTENIAKIQVTANMASEAIKEAEGIMAEMNAMNFSTIYINDSLIEARKAFQRAGYADILRGEINATEKEKQTARQALAVVRWQNITYEDVLTYTQDIKNRKQQALFISDKLEIWRIKITGLSGQTRAIYVEARIAFGEERYNDAEKLLEQFVSAVEQEKADISTLTGIKNGISYFFQKYWIYILLLAVVLVVLGRIFYKKLEKKMFARRIIKMKAEEKALNDLMRKTQTERFKENKISGLVYKIRMEKYQEKLGKIKEELPALEDRLRRFKNYKNLV